MLVRDAGESWQLVLQPDHADLSGQLARAWGGEGFAAPEPFDSVVLAATRHDDGWAVWERRPRLDANGAPQSFFTVPIPVHLSFYRAGVEVVHEEDPYAGLLVSMHMSGLYRARYGVMPAATPSLEGEDRELAAAFAEQEEARQAHIAKELGADESQRWTNYALLQVFDIVSLYFGLADVEAGTEGSFEGVPTAGGERVRIAISPTAPWRVRFDPFPFRSSPTVLSLARRLVPKRAWDGDAAFRRDFDAAAVETVRIVAER
jgi:Protein of unknown function (DUF3891)